MMVGKVGQIAKQLTNNQTSKNLMKNIIPSENINEQGRTTDRAAVDWTSVTYSVDRLFMEYFCRIYARKTIHFYVRA